MIKPLLDTVDSLKHELFKASALVDRLQKKDAQTIQQTNLWIRTMEDILMNAGQAQCAELAGLRSKMLNPEFSELKRIDKNREKLRITAEIVFETQETVMKFLQPAEEKINEARTLIRQILLILKPTGILHYDPAVMDFNQFIQGIWNLLKTNEQVGGGISKILSMLNPADAMRILAEEIELNHD